MGGERAEKEGRKEEGKGEKERGEEDSYSRIPSAGTVDNNVCDKYLIIYLEKGKVSCGGRRGKYLVVLKVKVSMSYIILSLTLRQLHNTANKAGLR